MSSSSDRLNSIDVLRGVAALAVVATHIPHHTHGGWRQHPFVFPGFLIDYGWLGVPLFVVISGFCIHLRAAKYKLTSASFSWRRFWVRRFYRLYPPYLAAIGFSLLFAVYLHDAYDVAQAWPGDLLTHLALVHNLTEYAGGLGNGSFWSLGMEEQLYLLYALLLVLVTTVSWRAGLGCVMAVSVAWFALGLTGVQIVSWDAWPFQFWLYWTLGAFAVDAWFGNIRLPKWCYSARVAAFLLLFGLVTRRECWELLMSTQFAKSSWWLNPDMLDGPIVSALDMFSTLFVFAVAFFIIINYCIERERTGGFNSVWSRGLVPVGRISYSLYLTHLPVIYALQRVVPLGNSPLLWLVRYLIYVPVCLVVGFAFYQIVERWFLRTPKALVSPIELRRLDTKRSARPVAEST